MSLAEAVIIWLLAINILAVVVYRYDKINAARSRGRVRESHLLLLALLGGSPAAYIAMYLIKPPHKTRKFSFLWKFWGIVFGQLGLIWLSWQFWQRP